jgi:lysozyme family protein
MGVNIGVGTAVRFLQFALINYGARLNPDSFLGDQTRKAAYAVPDTNGLCMLFLAKLRKHYEELAQRPGQSKFLSGWLNRVDAAKGLLT